MSYPRIRLPLALVRKRFMERKLADLKTGEGGPLKFFILRHRSRSSFFCSDRHPRRQKEWFGFCRYSENHVSRTLLNSEIQIAIDQSTPFIMRYAQLTRATPNENLPRESFQKMKNLIIDIDKLFSRQFYLSQALEETSHVLYWDISEGDLG